MAPLGTVTSRRLGAVQDAEEPVQVVAAGYWQAARSLGAFTLAGCTVAPGFDFADFLMLRDVPDRAAEFRLRHPAAADLI